LHEVDRLENVADEILHETLSKIFLLDDVKMILKLKECYDYLETATDKCETAAHVIEDILIKHFKIQY
jgi:hypothetical protein